MASGSTSKRERDRDRERLSGGALLELPHELATFVRWGKTGEGRGHLRQTSTPFAGPSGSFDAGEMNWIRSFYSCNIGPNGARTTVAGCQC